MKMYAQVGTLYCADLDVTTYQCGSYAVACKRGSAEEALVSCLIEDNHTFLQEEDLIARLKMFRASIDDWKIKLKINPKKVIKSLMDARLLIKGEGSDEKEAIREILDKTSFWAWIYPGASNQVEGLMRAAPDYCFAALNPHTLSADEARIYNFLIERAKENEKIMLHEIHHEEHHKKYYVTIDSLEKMLAPEGLTRDDIYRAVERLYTKHCISLHHKVPQYTSYPEWDIFDSYAIFPVGKDIGLKDYTPSAGELFRKILEEYYSEKAKKEKANG